MSELQCSGSDHHAVALEHICALRLARADSSVSSEVLVSIACRAIIDATFAVEQQLVDAGLQDWQPVGALEQLLRQPLIYALQCEPGALDDLLTAQLLPDAAACTGTLQLLRGRLDHELTEVILWRIGSLRHMFSSTCCSAAQPLPAVAALPNFFTVAVAALQLVREVRPRAGAFDDVVSSSPDDSLFLMRHALYSDTHVLTLCFVGELSLRAVLSAHPSASALRPMGREALQLYVQACEGPLKQQGWSPQQALENLRLLA